MALGGPVTSKPLNRF